VPPPAVPPLVPLNPKGVVGSSDAQPLSAPHAISQSTEGVVMLDRRMRRPSASDVPLPRT
jgi:hypothetical protein